MAVITLADITKTYGDVAAVSDLSVSIDSGELYGLLGPNGAGKTTTIEILTGQTVPDSGRISVNGIDPVANPIEARSQLGIQPERESPPSFLTPREYLRLVGDLRGLSRETIDDRIRTWATRFGFTDQLETLHTNLSQGQKQTVMVTQAFIHNPSLVIIDEPLVNLDPGMQERVKSVVTEMATDDRTVLLSTHDIGVAAAICTRVGIVAGGEVVTEVAVESDTTETDLLDVFRDATGIDTAVPSGAIDE